MGTRNLEVVILNGEVRVGQYCQWDGYPSGQGLTALGFLRDKMDMSEFIQKIKNSTFVTEEELKNMWTDCGADPKSDMVSMDVSERFNQRYPWLHRDCGAKIFEMIQEQENGIKLTNRIGFAADSLFCEWAYLVDLDKNTLEVYKGFNQTPLKENDRFHFLQKPGSEYYPIKQIAQFDLNNLPTDEEFLNKLNQEEE